MSLYYEAASFIDGRNAADGSMRSRVYAQKSLKSNPGSVYALLSESARWSSVLSPILEKADILRVEKKLSPSLALLLTHDLLLAKRGIAAPKDHELTQAISRHKARLNAEFIRMRVKSGHTSVEAWKRSLDDVSEQIGKKDGQAVHFHPRWVRVNSLSSSLARETASGGFLDGWTEVGHLHELLTRSPQRYFVDSNVRDLVATPPGTDLTKSNAYKEGRIILQDKASCFPATLLDPQAVSGDVIDGCSAPGNKATHLAALCRPSAEPRGKRTVFAVERDQYRSKVLQKMVDVAVNKQPGLIECLGGQDFSKLEPLDTRWSNVGAILLDPSCSGSGIVGRDEANEELHDRLILPQLSTNLGNTNGHARSRKRKRNVVQVKTAAMQAVPMESHMEQENEEHAPLEGLEKRLEGLSNFQLTLLKHAFRFPSARRVVYSTCSVHAEENELVVIRALQSKVGRDGGWRLLKRGEQVEGMRRWHIRGDREAVDQYLAQGSDGVTAETEAIADACIRCHKAGSDGTMGFFAVGFVRDKQRQSRSPISNGGDGEGDSEGDGDEDDANVVGGESEEEFEGFSDSEPENAA